MKYKNIEEYLIDVRTVDEENRRVFLLQATELINTLNWIDTQENKGQLEASYEELTRRLNTLIATIDTEQLLRWFPKSNNSVTKEVK